MNTLQIAWLAATTGGFIALLSILMVKRESGSAMLAAVLSGGFASYTAIQIAQEGVIGFYTNHTQNLTGLQVWWDLVMCAMIALFFIAPRARKMGMNVTAWGILVGGTASIGLLAMCARLFWLENRAANADA
ncbi:hypothetical protein [Porphyrobacter sp. YT40]|uniref:hypothetical protein n=1 Tax=Porphyrobacter sp. YT40 TaxID=2547601 RepID=UPI001144936E|nr:hypothetical protein [Porphyrobacter sp. YT40]QDH34516.1 hypothetical protein E2E27_09385 [Porphyrobacter sp. YT40]